MTRFRFDVDAELTAGAIVGVSVTTPEGKVVQLYGDLVLAGRNLVIQQFAIYGEEVAPGYLGAATLRAMARDAMETFAVDSIRIEEARRISGANPGRAITITSRRHAGSDDPGFASSPA